MYNDKRSSTEPLTSKKLSEEFMKMGYTSLTDIAIRKLETGARQLKNIDEIKAYSDFFNVSADYLLGLSKAFSKDEDMKMICDTLGISEKSVENIKELSRKRDENKYINLIDLLCSKINDLVTLERLVSRLVDTENVLYKNNSLLYSVVPQLDSENNVSYVSSYKDNDAFKIYLSETPNGEPIDKFVFGYRELRDIQKNQISNAIWGLINAQIKKEIEHG